MAAVSRFVEFSVNAATLISTTSSTSKPTVGTRGFSKGTGLGATGTDKFTVVGGSVDQLNVSIHGVGPRTITLTSGTNLDPRFVARDITYKLNAADNANGFKHAQCNWRNGGGGANATNSFIIYSGDLGNDGGTNIVSVASPGVRDARTLLGFNTVVEQAGSDGTNSYTGTVAISGTYGGQFDDVYTVIISDNELVGTATKLSGLYSGTVTAGGAWNASATDTYTLTIDTTNGATMGAGTGNVPRFTVTDSPGTDDNSNPIELLYPSHWYDVGSNGLRVKFSDAVFGNGDTFQVVCSGASGSGYPKAVGAAKYVFVSQQGDNSKLFNIAPITTSTGPGTQLGTRGLTIAFSNTSNLALRDQFSVVCRGPREVGPTTQLNFGNVTVSTNSPVKVVWYELISGAITMSTVKWSLQSHGTFAHHDAGDGDTEFHFGTVGAGDPAAGAGPTSNSQVEWPVDANGLGKVLATDIDSDTPPNFLSSTQADLAVVNSADNAELVSNFQSGLVSDFVFLAIQLGANETGANSTINYRVFFDFN